MAHLVPVWGDFENFLASTECVNCVSIDGIFRFGFIDGDLRPLALLT